MDLSAADFVWFEFAWSTEVRFPEWADFRQEARRVRRDRLGDAAAAAAPDLVDVVFAPGSRGDAPLRPREIQAVQWLVDHRAELSRTAVDAVFAEYPAIRDDVVSTHGVEVAASMAPPIDAAEDLRAILGLREVIVHRVDGGDAAYVGFILGCTWDDEHGVGILLHGTRVVAIGDGDAASREMIPVEDAARLKAQRAREAQEPE